LNDDYDEQIDKWLNEDMKIDWRQTMYIGKYNFNYNA
jgi:hypothetical protein